MHNSVGTHWIGIALYVNGSTITYFDSFGVEHILLEIKKIIGYKNIKTNIYRVVQSYDSIMWGHFCIGFINFIFKGISLLSPHNFKKTEKIILNYSLK